MVGRVNTSKYLKGALVGAVVAHVLLLALKLNFESSAPLATPTLSIKLLVEEPPTKQSEIKPLSKPKQTEQARELPSPPLPPLQKVITTSEKEPEAHTTIRLNSQNIRAFVKQEVHRYQQENPTAMEDFSETFEPVVVEVPADTNYRDLQGPMAGGNYKVRRNGKVYCVLHFVPLSFDDYVNGGSYGGAMDCTPKKKFELNPFPSN